MPTSLVILQQPPILNFSGNPIPYTILLSPYGVFEQQQNIQIKVRLETEVADFALTYTLVKEQVMFPDKNGKVQFDISSLADAYLTYYTPRPGIKDIVKATGQSRKFKLVITAQKDGIKVGDTVTSNIINVIKGGMAYQEWNQNTIFNDYLIAQKKPLAFFADSELAAVDEKKYLYFVYPSAIIDRIIIFFEYFRDGAWYDQYIGLDAPESGIQANQYKVYCCPAGLLDLFKLTDGIDYASFINDVPMFRLSVVIHNLLDTTVIINPVLFNVDHRNFYDARQLLYRNSLGGIDTIRLLGETDLGAEYTVKDAERTVPPNAYIGGLLEAKTVISDVGETEKYTGGTDFVSKQKIHLLRDLFLSKLVREWKDGKMLPVVINRKNVKFYSSKESLTSLVVEWQNAYSNSFYTPVGIDIDYEPACPALDNFIVTQLTKNSLQISWAMPMPYEQIEVEINTGVGTPLTIQLNGNADSQQVIFTNPAVAPDPTSITVKGRVICDPDSNPVFYGPYSTVVLNVYANALPVAIADILVLAAGYTTLQPLPGSILANDYDPDGDVIEAVAVVNADTDSGGKVTINAAGEVSYKAPSSIFNGIDTYTYTIREAATPAATATATIYFHVGNINLGSNTYIKIVERQHYQNVNGITTTAGGEFYCTCWADPLCTIPKDISTLGIIPVIRTKFYQCSAPTVIWTLQSQSTQPLFFLQGGANTIEKLFYQGETLRLTHLITVYRGNKKEFSVDAGAGYIVV